MFTVALTLLFLIAISLTVLATAGVIAVRAYLDWLARPPRAPLHGPVSPLH